MDDLTCLKIELAALRDTTTPTDEDYKKAIIEEFEDCEEWESWMVDPLLDKFKETIAFRRQMESFCEGFLHNFLRI